MTKLESVKLARKENTPALFNMALALKALKDTPARVRKGGATSDLSEKVMALFKEAGTGALACNQVKAALEAGGMSVTSKQVADRLWLLAKQQRLVKGEAKGTYAMNITE